MNNETNNTVNETMTTTDFTSNKMTPMWQSADGNDWKVVGATQHITIKWEKKGNFEVIISETPQLLSNGTFGHAIATSTVFCGTMSEAMATGLNFATPDHNRNWECYGVSHKLIHRISPHGSIWTSRNA
jgi:hypothetical protein